MKLKSNFILLARNGNQSIVQLILKDVNDNAPEMPEKADYEVEENANEVRSEITSKWWIQ